MHISKTIRLFACISLASAAVLGASSAFGRPEMPGKLQEVAGMTCVPLCTMCHTSNPGQADNWTMKALGQQLYLPIKNQQDIKPAYDAWKAANTNLASGVVNGYEPTSVMNGHPENVCGPIYGCTVPAVKHVTSSHDYVGVLWMGGAMIVGGLLRRRKRAR
ncbi:MAG TPA: hypothetical protein VHB79_34305 [Polyangiaceae bacterium]|nr:hypothetical protein [Polyangiaceae bacterium]